MAQSEFVGVDGCPAGWFSVGLDQCGGYENKKFKKFSQLLAHYSNASLILVDIPIGLPEGPEGRDCDEKARALLCEPRRRSVFRTPTRQTAEYAVKPSGCYDGAKKIEKQSSGKGLSKQSFEIASKIDEVDKALADRSSNAAPRIREVHPELCFWALNNGRPMEFSKKKPEGKCKRLSVLESIEPRTRDIYAEACSKYLRKDVARDDILDALVAAVTAFLGRGRLQTISSDPPQDAKGLPMEMVFCMYQDPLTPFRQ